MPETIEVVAEAVQADAGAKPVETVKPVPSVPEPVVVLAWRDSEVKVLNRILTLLDEIGISEVQFHANKGLCIRQMDESRVCLVDVRMSFGQTSLDETEIDRSFIIDLQKLQKAMKQISEPMITVAEEAVVRGSIGSRNVEVTIPLIAEDISEVPEPNIKYKVKAEVDFDVVDKALKTLAKNPDSLAFDAAKKQLVISGMNDEGQTLKIDGTPSKGKGRAVYPIAYLEALKSKWNIEYATDMPMHASKVEFAGTGDEERQFASINIHLAPRIEVE